MRLAAESGHPYPDANFRFIQSDKLASQNIRRSTFVSELHMPSLDTMLLFLVLIGVGSLLVLYRKGLPAYVSEKGKNLATREDIEEITRKIESVRGDISRANAVEEQKRILKYEACLEALSVIDAHFSQLFAAESPTPQPISAVRAREAHSKLILSCNNVLIVEKFGEIYFGPRAVEPSRPPTDLLNEFRNLVRKELDFGSELPLDRERAWIGRASGDPETPASPSSLLRNIHIKRARHHYWLCFFGTESGRGRLDR